MTRRLLILGDILVISLLLLSFILFYFYPPKREQISNYVLPSEQNMTIEDLIGMGEKSTKEDVMDVNLEEKLILLSAKVGDRIFIRIFKEESLLEVWIHSGTEYQHLKDYAICSFSGDLGPKLKEGDGQSPEGFYKVKKYQLNPNSKFHLSFNLGFPNRYDRAHKRTGSYLMVHGDCVSIGCYAMTDEKIEEIYALLEGALDKGQKYIQVHAYPFRMTEDNMARHSENPWYDFWVNLKEGYDYFEAEKLPPKVKVKNKLYSIQETDD